jgi:hypothetical protein
MSEATHRNAPTPKPRVIENQIRLFKTRGNEIKYDRHLVQFIVHI